MSVPSPDHLKALEQTRQRLVQLTQSLGSLVHSINQNDPLPPWSSLQSQASILSNNLVSIAQLLHEHRDTLASMVAYPTPQFPGRTEAGMLSQLVRTKLEPKVEEWVARGRSVGSQTAPGATDTATWARENAKTLTADELRELWRWAPLEANEEARRRNWGGEYTLEEKEMGLENVVTGLRRKLVEEDEEEGESEEGEEEGGEGGEMEVVGEHAGPAGGGVNSDISRERKHVPSAPVSTAMPLNDVFRFMMTGATPK
ncbi:hypothetical protein VTO42DRAFT_4966 [Malbranchea cinnamomea]